MDPLTQIFAFQKKCIFFVFFISSDIQSQIHKQKRQYIASFLELEGKIILFCKFFLSIEIKIFEKINKKNLFSLSTYFQPFSNLDFVEKKICKKICKPSIKNMGLKGMKSLLVAT